ncbi:MAG: ABC transporter permease [Chloroflexi bacterium]|nr:ABC transporter permease [Chloroflexota bacterium]
MTNYILRRIFYGILSLWAVVTIVFLIGRASGDPVSLFVPIDARADDVEYVRKRLGLDRPVYVQYASYMGGLVQGDFGKSMRWGSPVKDVAFPRLLATLQLVWLTAIIILAVSIPVGVFSAVKRGKAFDTFGKAFALFGQSAPTFWIGLMLIILFAVVWKVLPAGGRGDFRNLILPAFTLGIFGMAAVTRLTRSAMLNVLDSDYIKMLRAKGVPEQAILWRHALKNASLPVLTLFGLQLVGLMTGAVITETVFAWPGLGRLAVEAIFARDYAMVQFIVLLGSSLFITMNLIVDILYAYLDPRIRYT